MNRTKLSEFIKELKKLTNVRSEALLEKDFYLTVLLDEMEKAGLGKDFIFKGGTCLSKAYLDYPRISEDLDFNWKDRKEFEGLSKNKIKKTCSKKISEIGEKLAGITARYGMDFKVEKENKHYIQISSNGKQVTFKIWYESVFEKEQFIKIQVSFMEEIIFPSQKKDLKHIFDPDVLNKNEKEFFEEFIPFYTSKVTYEVFDAKEMLSEKTRALLSRRKIKTRDILDIYLIQKKYNMDMNTFRKQSKDKLIFAIQNYEKYKDNFENITEEELTKEDLLVEDIRELLVIEIDMNDFNSFVDKFLVYINDFIKEVKEELK